MKRCALLTCENLEDYVADETHLEMALKEADWQYEWVQWKDTAVDWNSYDCAIVRTTWDYTKDVKLFLENLKKIDQSSCQLFNDYSLILWNSDKIYLKELSELDLPVIPTLWKVYTGISQVKEAFATLEVEKLVIKPRISAGAINTFLISKEDLASYQEELKVLVGEDIMIQPFLKQVKEEGEYSAHFFNGSLSHVVLKKPKSGDFRSQEEFGSDVKLVELSEEQFSFCQLVLSKIKKPWLFARVDFIKNQNGEASLIELELIEPALYFRYKEGSAAKLVEELGQLI